MISIHPNDDTTSAQGQEWNLCPPQRHRQDGRPVCFAADRSTLRPTASQQGLRLPLVSGRQGRGEVGFTRLVNAYDLPGSVVVSARKKWQT